MRVQRVWMRDWGAESWTVLGDDHVPVEPVEPWLAYLTVIERSQHRQGVCHDLKDSFVFLQVSLAAANDKLAQLDRRARNATPVNLGVPIFTGNR